MVVSYEDIQAKNYSFSAGQHFDIKIGYEEITAEEFEERINLARSRLDKFNLQAEELKKEIDKSLVNLNYDT